MTGHTQEYIEDGLLLRDAILNFKSAHFGIFNEKFVELFLRYYGLIVESPDDSSYDRKIDKSKDEIKGARAYEKLPTMDFIDESIIYETAIKYGIHELAPFDKRDESNFDCNIQQIKPELFEDLYYSLYFWDKVLIFKVSRDQMLEDKVLGYNDKQHRGNEGEGQFHIKKDKIEHHLKNYLLGELTYKELYKLLKNEL